MPVDSLISFDEVEAGVVVISLKLVVDFFEEGKKVLASRFEAIVLDEASVGNVVKFELLVFIAIVVDIFIVVLVVVVPRLLADDGAPNSVLASAIDKVDEPPVATSTEEESCPVDDDIVDVVKDEEEEEEEDKSVVIESLIVAETRRGGSGFDIMASTFLLPPPLLIFATLLMVVVGPTLFSSMPLPLDAITELLDSSSLKYDGAFARRYFIFPLLIRSACNCGGRAMHPTANGTNHMAARMLDFISFLAKIEDRIDFLRIF